MILVTNHVNSYSRPTLGDRRPYGLTFEAMPKDFFDMLALEMFTFKEAKLRTNL